MTEINLEDLESQSICRSCLSSDVAKDEFKVKYRKSTFEQIFQNCTGIQGITDASYPKDFCSDCIDLLKSFQNFKLKALSSHTNLVVKLEKLKGLKIEYSETVKENVKTVESDEEKVDVQNVPAYKKEILIVEDIKSENEDDSKDEDWNNDKDCDYENDDDDDSSDEDNKRDFNDSSVDLLTPDVVIKEKSEDKKEKFEYKRQKNRDKENDDGVKESKLSWECPICHIVLHTAKDIKTHKYREKKKRLQVYECPYCKKKYERYQLKNHIKMHTDGKPYVCEVCGKRLSSNIHLRKHMMIHFGKKFKCEQCGQGFTENYLLKDHMNVHENKTPHLCIRCGKAFATLTAWHQHNKRSKCKTMSENPDLLTEKPKKKKTSRPKPKPKDIGEDGKEKPKTAAKRFICSECGKVLKGKNNYEIHIALHQDKATYQYQCYVCGKKFGHKVALKNHLWVHNLSYRCAKCLKIYVSTQIKTHECIPVDGGQNDFLPNECRICRQILSSEIYMDKHLNTHKERKCTYCSETYTDAKKLMYHMNSHKLKCDLCGRGFAKNKSLREHINKQICVRGLSRKERIKKKT